MNSFSKGNECRYCCFCFFRWDTTDNDFFYPTALLSSPAAPPGTGFATGTISLGDIVLAQISSFEQVWSTFEGGIDDLGATFFKPVNLPPGFSCLGYYSQPNRTSSEGWILVAKRSGPSTVKDNSCFRVMKNENDNVPDGSNSRYAGHSLELLHQSSEKSALASPVGYTLVWSSTLWNGKASGCGYFWLPTSPDGYRSLGYVVTNNAEEPSIQEVMCVRSDLTDICMVREPIWGTDTESPFSVWNLMPLLTGTETKGIHVGTFYCSNNEGDMSTIPIACLKTAGLHLSSMPSLVQVHALMRNYGPTIFFHPDEIYFPSSVYWLFSKNVLLYSQGDAAPVVVSGEGSNLPAGGTDDGKYWIDFPNDGSANAIKAGDLSTAEVYVHVKPVLGGTFTDLAIWIYYPFNGAATAKIEFVDVKLGKIGEHISDWEHFTLRISNFTGKLSSVYFSEHSGGVWVNASDLEYLEDSKGVIYSAKNGHANYPHPGLVLQGDHGVGIRNDTARSNFSLDSSKNYKVISAEYLNMGGHRNAPEEPTWLQYMRKWGPKVQYDSQAELEKVLQKLPAFLRSKLQSLANKFPDELFCEEGPTGPKEKASWVGDEKV